MQQSNLHAEAPPRERPLRLRGNRDFHVMSGVAGMSGRVHAPGARRTWAGIASPGRRRYRFEAASAWGSSCGASAVAGSHGPPSYSTALG